MRKDLRCILFEALFLSESAVEKHVSAIFGKLGRPREPHVHRRVAAVLAFLQDTREESRGRDRSPCDRSPLFTALGSQRSNRAR